MKNLKEQDNDELIRAYLAIVQKYANYPLNEDRLTDAHTLVAIYCVGAALTRIEKQLIKLNKLLEAKK